MMPSLDVRAVAPPATWSPIVAVSIDPPRAHDRAILLVVTALSAVAAALAVLLVV